jgi:hypothetical protein
MDQLDSSQLPCSLLGRRTLRVLLFQYAVHCHARFDQYHHSTCYRHLYRLHHLLGNIPYQYIPGNIFVAACRHLRVTGGYFHSTTEVGDGGIHDDLHPRYPSILIRAPPPRILEHG